MPRQTRRQPQRCHPIHKVQQPAIADPGPDGTALKPPPLLKAFRIQDESDDRKPRSLLDVTRQSLYVRYKTSDKKIEDGLASLVPPEIYQPVKHGINGISKAADYIVENELDVDNAFFITLKESIRDRRNMAVHEYHGGDEGHLHVIEVLEYCWARLQPRRKTKATFDDRAVSKPEADVNALRNRFDKLSTEHDHTECSAESEDEPDADDESDLPQGPRPRPKAYVRELEKTRTYVVIFLATLDEIMGCTAAQFKDLADVVAQAQKNEISSRAIVEKMMEASVATNIAIQEVAALEQVFYLEHPHLNTLYRMLAKLINTCFTRQLMDLVTAKSPIASEFSENDAVMFVGDAYECSFRDSSDPNCKPEALEADFLERWRFPDDSPVSLGYEDDTCLHGILACIQTAVLAETRTEHEYTPECMSFFERNGIHSHVWLTFPYIGKNRSITSTIRRLQGVSPLIQELNGRISLGRQWFGGDWADRTEPATRIQVEMDSLLLCDILPPLINMCYQGMMSKDVPYQNEIFAGFAQTKRFVQNPERPVSWALAFSIHAILTSVFELQAEGINHCKMLAVKASYTVDKFMFQLYCAGRAHPTQITQRPPMWDTNITSLKDLWYLTSVNLPQTRKRHLLSVWNPYCAGAFLSYTAYYGNLEGGATLIDCVGQLRMTLHLFNALKQARAISPGQIVVLDKIFEIFKGCNAIWEGALPGKGQFKARWKKVEMTRSKSDANSNPIFVEELSKSFRKICLLDFRGGSAKDSKRKRPRKRQVGYAHAIRVNSTLDAMADETEGLSTNLVSMGYQLIEFIDTLFSTFGLMDRVKKLVHEMKQGRCIDSSLNQDSWEANDAGITYKCMSRVFGNVVLEHLDNGDEWLTTKLLVVLDAYFNTLYADTKWFGDMDE